MTHRLRNFGKRLSIAALAALCSTARAADERTPIVLEGQPCADIVIAENPPRAVHLAAAELQTTIARISGAEIPILTAPGDAPVQIYVGRSRTTDELGVSDDGLADGAYLVRSGPGRLILFGRDRDFAPMEPRLHDSSPQERDRVHAELDALTGSTWDLPQGFHWLGMNSSLNIHLQDECGSLNAVYAFLRDLGVEWYMPGEQGEIVPRRSTIALPEVDRLVRPDFALRYLHGAADRFANREATLWYLRLGLNHASSRTGLADTLSHPLRSLTTREEMRRAHPEYFAVRAGRRAIDMNTPCLSSEGLFRETVRYVRFLLDQYDLPLVSLSLEDGAIYCDCPLCIDQKSPELGWTGSGSEYVWAFADRVAREVYKTHPDRKLVMTAYANYTVAPPGIAKLSPNLCVGLVQQRVRYHDPERRQEDLAQRRAWLEKMAADSRFIVWTHYPYTLRSSRAIPEYFPHRIAADLRSLKGLSLGEFIEVQFDRDPQRIGAIHAPGFNHLNIFVTARAYWDAELDIDALLSTYTERFYGPAAAGMRELIEYCEAHVNRQDISNPASAAVIERVFELLAAAQAQAPEDSVYAERIALLADFVQPLRALGEQLARGRDNVPAIRIRNLPEPPAIVFDGKLDEEAWRRATGQGAMKDCVTGEKPVDPTSFKIFLADSHLYIGVRCNDPDAANLNIPTTKNGDQSIWDGDVIELLLETQEHSYYQVTVNPAGALFDLDRLHGGFNAEWSAGAEVATSVDDRGWTLEMRLPFTDSDLDPLHYIVGTIPTWQYPWHFNLCRVRIRGKELTVQAVSPTGALRIHKLERFAKLHTGVDPEAVRRSHEASAARMVQEKTERQEEADGQATE